MKICLFPAYVAFVGGDLLAQSQLTVTTAALPEAVFDQPYSLQLTRTGGSPPYTWSGGSELQSIGLSLSSTGLLSGVPKSYVLTNFLFTLKDGSGKEVTKFLQFYVIGALNPGSEPLAAGEVGFPYRSRVIAIGGFGVTFGTTPPGINLESNGRIEGTPTFAGTWTFTIQGSAAGAAARPFTIVISDPNQPLAFNIVPEVQLKLGVPADIVGNISGIAPPHVVRLESGSLPEGMRWQASPFRITGAPSKSGTYPLVFGARDRAGFQKAFGSIKLIIAGRC